MAERARNIGGSVTSKVLLTPRDAVEAAAFALEGPGVAKKDAHSALIVVQTGPLAGTVAPDSTVVTYKLQESAVESDGATWTDVVVSASNPVVGGSLTLPSTRSLIEIDLSPLKEFFRVVFTVAHTNGTAPTIGLTAEAIVGGLMGTPTHA